MSAKDYDHQKIEQKWQKKWAEQDLYKVVDQEGEKENYYTLFEFPYPSGNLHVGHWYAYAPTDVIARFERMNGKNVLFPIGFDSFGLPAENAAIKRGLDPMEWTYSNIETMTEQIKSIGTSVDWSREVRTSDPEYYKWTQYIFTKFFEQGLAYEDTIEVNYCPSCKTILANEQVINGKCDRCSSVIEKRAQKQWMLKITDYAEQLLNDLDQLDWPEEIKASQRAWIGKSIGATFKFQIKDSKSPHLSIGHPNVVESTPIEVFTTRPDTFYGVTYLVLSPEHQITSIYRSSIKNIDEVEKYIKRSKVKSDIERQENRDKTGVLIEGIKAIHPATSEELPIFVADYVLGSYGTGAVMAVPAHDERDFEFATKFNLPIKQVVTSIYLHKNFTGDLKGPTRSDGSYGVIINNKNEILLQRFVSAIDDCNEWRLPGGGLDKGESFTDGLFRELEEETGYKFSNYEKYIGSIEVYFKAIYNDFAGQGIKREKRAYLLHFENCENGICQPDDYEQELEYKWFPLEEAWETMSKNAFFKDEFFLLDLFVNPKPITEKGAIVNSGEYNGLTSEEAGQKITNEFGEVATTYRLRDWSVGRQRYWGCPIPIVYDPDGRAHPIPAEHLPWILPNDVDHTPDGTAPLARSQELKKRTEKIFGPGYTPATDTFDAFVDSSWYYVRYTDPTNSQQLASNSSQSTWLPVDFYSGGAEHTTMHLLYSRFFYKAMRDCELVVGDEPFKHRLNRSLILGPDGNKMSKSKGNVIDPDEQVANVGSDAIRMYLCFIGPYNQVAHYPWDPNGLVGVRKFLERVNGLTEYVTDDSNKEVEVALHQTIKTVSESITQRKLNTGVSALMIFANVVADIKIVTKSQLATYFKLLSPYVPHLAEEWWNQLGNSESIHLQPWPHYDRQVLKSRQITIPVQINGKRIGEISVDQDSSQDAIIHSIQGSELAPKIDFSEVKKVIYVPNRIINLVVDKKA